MKTRPKKVVRMSMRTRRFLADFGGPHTNGHAEARGDQHDGVESAERHAELVGRDGERRVVPVAIEQVGEEHAAEEHDFREQEEPHAEAADLALLLFGLKVMTVLRQRGVLVLGVNRVLGVVMALSNGRHLMLGLLASHS